MQKQPLRLLTLMLLLLQGFIACRNAAERDAPSSAPFSENAPQETRGDAEKAKAPVAPEADTSVQSGDIASSSAAVPGQWDLVKKLVRTSELRFRTDNVLQTTLAIEDIVRQNGGFVLENNLTNTVESHESVQVSRDSNLETSIIRVANQMRFRVPAAQLDTTLRAIGARIARLDYRRIHATDVSLDYLEQQLENLRQTQYRQDIQGAIAQNGNKLKDITAAQDKALSGRVAADAAHLEQLRINDAVALSIVQVDLYQHPLVIKELRPLVEPVAAWQPGLGARLGDAFLGGWSVAERLMVFFLGLWPIWLLIAFVVLVFRKGWLSPASTPARP